MKAAAILALPLLLAACGETSSTHGAGAPATTPGKQPCPHFEGSTGAGPPTKKPTETMLLTDVKVDANGCSDRIVFDFRPAAGGTEPSFSAEYRPADEAQTEDASGRHIPIAGKAFLVVRFEPAATADLSKPELEITYKGPRTIKPAGLRWVRQVSKTGDFEAVLTWSIGLSEQRPFHVVTSGSPARVSIVFG
jgi:hypothetical protein